MTLRELIQRLMDQQGMSEADLVRSSGVHKGQLNEFLSKKRKGFGPDTLLAICRALDGNWSQFQELAGIAPTVSQKPIVVGISGGSCAGKTWLADQMRMKRPKEVEVVDLDGYYLPIAKVNNLTYGHDNPESVDFRAAEEALVCLMAGKNVDIPKYSKRDQRRVGAREAVAKPIIIIEGLFIFADERLRDKMDLRIWMEASVDKRMHRRVNKETEEEVRPFRESLNHFGEVVSPAHSKFIEPLREHADVAVLNEVAGVQQSRLVEMIDAYIERMRAGTVSPAA